jgi:hypothetical protein
MATTIKKNSKKKKSNKRRSVVKTSVQTIAELRQQLAECLQRENATAAELNESLRRETATREIWH